MVRVIIKTEEGTNIKKVKEKQIPFKECKGELIEYPEKDIN